MLTLVGLGLNDEKDLSVRGIEACKEADKIYVDSYTGIWRGNFQNMESMIGKKPEMLHRSSLEENSWSIIQEAKEKNIVILVPGDPLVATTHTMLLMDAKSAEVETRIIHNASIFSAVAETGLHIYKFGATVTIPNLEKTKGVMPESIYKIISENKSHGMHTLCLLDLVNGKNIEVSEAFRILKGIDKDNILGETADFIVFSRGPEKAQIVFGNMEKASSAKIGDPAVIIICGNLHFTERDYLESLEKGL